MFVTFSKFHLQTVQFLCAPSPSLPSPSSQVQARLKTQALPIRQYLEATVAPVVMQGMQVRIWDPSLSLSLASVPQALRPRPHLAPPDAKFKPAHPLLPSAPLSSLQALIRERPDDPLEYLGTYLLKESAKRKVRKDGSAPAASK